MQFHEKVPTEFDEVEPYHWVFRHGREGEGGYEDHYLDEMTLINEHLEGMRETSSTFRPANEFDWWSSMVSQYKKIMSFFGSWKMPNRFRDGDSGSEIWINPNAQWSHKYSDAAVRCRCGSVVYTVENRANNHDFHQRCNDECLPQWKHRTWSKLWQCRQRVLTQAALMGHSKRFVSLNRIGLVEDIMRQLEDRLNLNYERLYELSRMKLRKTFIKLHEHFDVRNTHIGDAFGISNRSVRDYLLGRQSWFERFKPEVLKNE